MIGPELQDDDVGVWVAYNFDGSGFVVFASELEALRYALPYSMRVTFVRYGDPDWMHRPAPAT